MSDEKRTREQLALRFIDTFGTEVLRRHGFTNGDVTNERLAYDEHSCVRMRADVRHGVRGRRSVTVDDVGPFDMTDQRDLRDSLAAALDVKGKAALAALVRRMAAAGLWVRD